MFFHIGIAPMQAMLLTLFILSFGLSFTLIESVAISNTIMIMSAIGLTIIVLDMFARQKEFRRIYKILTKSRYFMEHEFPASSFPGDIQCRALWEIGAGYDIINKMSKSHCQRSMLKAVASAISEGHRLCLDIKLDEMGYRWYHIFPDGTPRVFFTWTWWKKTVGMK